MKIQGIGRYSNTESRKRKTREKYLNGLYKRYCVYCEKCGYHACIRLINKEKQQNPSKTFRFSKFILKPYNPDPCIDLFMEKFEVHTSELEYVPIYKRTVNDNLRSRINNKNFNMDRLTSIYNKYNEEAKCLNL